jgi:hypothetical protein
MKTPVLMWRWRDFDATFIKKRYVLISHIEQSDLEIMSMAEDFYDPTDVVIVYTFIWLYQAVSDEGSSKNSSNAPN